MGAILVAYLACGSVAFMQTGLAQDLNQNPKPAASAPASGTQTSPATAPGQAAPGQAAAGQAAAGKAVPAAPQITPEEGKAYNAIQGELDSARQLQLVDDFAKKYPNSPLLSDAYFYGAYGSQQQNDLGKVVDYGNKSLQANPNNLRSLLLMAGMLPQPQEMQGSDADKEKKLSDAEADANKALQLIPDLKQPKLTPDQLVQAKATLTSESHASLGMVHLQRATMGLTGTDAQELGNAEQEYKSAVTGTAKPSAEDYFRLGEIYQMQNKLDDAIDAFSQCSKLGQGSAIQSYADKQVDILKKKKAQGPPPAKP